MLEAMDQPWYRSPVAFFSIGWKIVAGVAGVVGICFVLALPGSWQDPAEFSTRFLQFIINGVMVG
ncbi:MAG: hypothetical protein ACE5I2_16140, partial [Anaerolineae bacterium]